MLLPCSLKFFLLLVFWLILEVSTGLNTSTEFRTAVIVSGQMKVGNIRWDSNKLRRDFASKMFGNEDPPTPIDTVIKFLIEPFAVYGGVDVFIYYQLKPDSGSIVNGVSVPLSSGERICDILGKHEIFKPDTGNKIFCLYELEESLLTNFVLRMPFWDTFLDKSKNSKERLLQHLYGFYRANLAAKQYSIMSEIKYTFKIRLNPDVAVVKAIPSVQSLVDDLNTINNDHCLTNIIYSNQKFLSNNAEDLFSLGKAEDMDILLDRYINITSSQFIFSDKSVFTWNSETYLLGLLAKYKICIEAKNAIWIVQPRLLDHISVSTLSHLSPPNDWLLINNDTSFKSLLSSSSK